MHSLGPDTRGRVSCAPTPLPPPRMEGVRNVRKEIPLGKSHVDLLKRYKARQGTPAWGKDYEPAIRATPQEAPSISRPTMIRSGMLDRDVHLLSKPEANAAFLALFHPNLFDLHEQRVLPTAPASHPLQGSPAGVGLRLPELPGTIAIAESLGALNRHPKVYYHFGGDEFEWVPLPFVGDLLLFLRDTDGPYCVNWNIKLTEEDYLRPGPRPLGRVRRRQPEPDAELRHLIEEALYEAAGIRTVRVTGSQLDADLVANLRDLFGWHGRERTASEQQRLEVLELLRAAIDGPRPAYQVVKEVAAKTSLTDYDVMVELYQAIWRRELRVDLFSPLLMTKRLVREREDPLQRYENWFRR